jgi:hypothetical protein
MSKVGPRNDAQSASVSIGIVVRDEALHTHTPAAVRATKGVLGRLLEGNKRKT